VHLPDQPGELARLSSRLRDAGVNLLGIWGGSRTADTTQLHCVPESPKAFRDFAEREGFEIEEGMTLFLHGADAEGVLTETLELIATAGVNIESIQAVAVGGDVGCFIWTAEHDWETLLDALG
jgi:hypothetical protein